MRLISFLGTGKYVETTYSFESKTCRTDFVAHALASCIDPKEIRLIATTEAWNLHGSALTQRLSELGFPVPKHVLVPTSGEPQHLWEMFEVIVEEIRTSNSPVLLDITHGFRMQPFFAAACIQYVQSVFPDSSTIRVVYGEFRGSETTSPIWELTTFVEVLSWSRNLMMFLQTGRADQVAESAEAIGRELSKQWANTDRSDPKPRLENLGKAIAAFSNDFNTIRTGSLLIGKDSTVHQLLYAIEQAKSEVAQQLPALAKILDKVQELIAPMHIKDSSLSSNIGQLALFALAKLYKQMGRHSEAISVLREGWITLGAPSNTNQPGTNEFENEWRDLQENIWRLKYKESRSVSEMRNDIQHAGFKRQPHEPSWFESQLETLLSEWKDEIDAMESQVHCELTSSRENSPVRMSPADNQNSVDLETDIIIYRIGVEHPITPNESLPPMPNIPRGALVVVEGRAPIWRYGMAFHLLHGSPAAAIAVFDPRLGAVVVASHSPDWSDGQIVKVSMDLSKTSI